MALYDVDITTLNDSNLIEVNDVKRVREVVELREEKAKVYELDNGLY